MCTYDICHPYRDIVVISGGMFGAERDYILCRYSFCARAFALDISPFLSSVEKLRIIRGRQVGNSHRPCFCEERTEIVERTSTRGIAIS